MRIVFMGTPDFAVPCLERLLADGHEVELAVTQADKPKGRGYALASPPVKVLAQARGIPVYQPATLRSGEAVDMLRGIRADVFVVVAYGRLLPPEVLALPRFGCLNVHGSLLPRWRGAAPIQWAVLGGDRESGVTVIQMDAGIDTGDMLYKRQVAVPPDMTAGELYGVLAPLGADALSRTLSLLERGGLHPEPQRDGDATHAPMLTKAMSPLDFTCGAAALHNQVRGLNPWPGSTCVLGGRSLKVWRTRMAEGAGEPGQVLSASPLTVACGGGALELTEVQPEGGRRMSGADWARGARL